MTKQAHTQRKTRAKAYKSAAFAAIHENMSDLHDAGVIDSKTMRSFEST